MRYWWPHHPAIAEWIKETSRTVGICVEEEERGWYVL
jgi:hypothetical protein